MLYATLAAWDMNSRGAKMAGFDEFKSNLRNNVAEFQAVEAAETGFTWTNRNTVMQALSVLYGNLALMETKARLVSNSKILHFVFPNLCPPMDGKNTLMKLYGHTAESRNKYLEILQFTYDILNSIQNPQQYLDAQWNTTATKLVDNALILWSAPTNRDVYSRTPCENS